MTQGNEQNQGNKNRSEKLIVRMLILAGLAISLPIYLLLMAVLGDWANSSIGVHGQESESSGSFTIKRLAGLEFAPIKLKPITNTEELLKSLLLTFEITEGAPAKRVYLRAGSMEQFTAKAMNSYERKVESSSWPNFWFYRPQQKVLPITKKAYIDFFSNFEARLPYPPILMNLAGKLKYCAMNDGSLLFAQTIAAGDEFEIQFSAEQNLSRNDKLDTVYITSPYLQHLSSKKVQAFANELVPENDPSIATVFKFVQFLEKNGIYKADFETEDVVHPVEDFLIYRLKGHCQHFAASLVALCRFKGIPSRVAVGFSSDLIKDGKFLVTGGMAHAWAEILTTDGWKIVDVSAKKMETKSFVAPSVELPSSRELELLRVKRSQQNLVKKSESGTSEPKRLKSNKLIPEESFSKPEKPGTLIKNGEKQKNSINHEAKKSAPNKVNLVKTVILAALTMALLYFIWIKIEKILVWLAKYLRKASEKKTVEDMQHEAETLKLLTCFEKINEIELQGADLVELFQRFTKLMAEKGQVPRSEHETAGEYFERLCCSFNLNPAEGKKAANFLEAELYGQQSTAKKDFQLFLKLLKRIIDKIC